MPGGWLEDATLAVTCDGETPPTAGNTLNTCFKNYLPYFWSRHFLLPHYNLQLLQT